MENTEKCSDKGLEMG